MEKLTITTPRSFLEGMMDKIGEKISFKESEHNASMKIAYVGGQQLGFVVSKDPLPGTVSPADLDGNLEDYNWTLAEIQDGQIGKVSVMIIATGTPKKAKRGSSKIAQYKFSFGFENETSTAFNNFKKARETELLPTLMVSVEDNELVLKFEDEIIGRLNSTTCDIDNSSITSYFENKPQEVRLGAMREAEKLLDVVISIEESELINIKKQASSGELDAKINEIVKNKITTKENILEILDYLTTCGIETKMQLAVLNTYKVYPKEVRALIKPKPPVPFVDQHGYVKTSIAGILKGKHLRYEGPKGAGKDLMIETLSWVFQRPEYRVNFNKQTDESVMFGEKTLATKNKHVVLEEVSENARTGETIKVFAKNITNLFQAMLGKSQDIVFERGPLTLAMEYGGFLNLNEINFANQANISILNNALDSNRSVYVPGYKLVHAVENFVAIASMNDGYVGTSQMNQALRDRFYPLMFEYPSDMSTFLKVRYPDANPDYLKAIDAIYADMVEHVVNIADLDPDAISTRGFIDVMDLADDLGLQEALTGAIVNRADNEDTRDLLRNIIDMHV